VSILTQLATFYRSNVTWEIPVDIDMVNC